ncbi:MAG: glycoside hydrolase family 88 protein [Candidatus Pedobacter colombiensis]|uniref:Glycoside hydrolase family 88 protein n=1 Tax=Candidatus Pedobacter colombiensis TaxID=3121371 RepID=A0AAJ5W4C7_9SPHI|nr:glycoside hydrolase family 88 protein [Pedobacter sp.]WEK17737.1 MAG: glycoside hydrolase family 88 protein [Pedobacter sp.]
MKTLLGAFVTSIALMGSTSSMAVTKNNGDDWLRKSAKTAVYQLTKAAQTFTPGMNPRSINPDGSVRFAPVRDWTTGFFPGTLWYGYELSGDKNLAEQAKRFTLGLDSVQYVKDTHDVGFMLYCSYGNAYRLTGDKVYLKPLENGAANLYARFNKKVGAIRSWDFGHWQFPVIIDNLMNLEYLYWAGKEFNKPEWFAAAKTHATTTMKNHFRKDYSSYHVISYDTLSGKVLQRETHQGLTHNSAWARGQAWGLYGYTMSYKDTKDKKFIEHAEHIAAFIMNHPKMPKDKIPLWDFDVHNADRSPRDASAAAVIASALLDLSTQVKDGDKYFKFAEDILKTLSTDEYLAKPGENQFFILKHSVGAFLYNSEIDTPLNYADYYFMEALKRYAELKKIDLKTIAQS